MDFGQTRPWKTGSFWATRRGSQNTDFYKSAADSDSLSVVGQLSILLVLIGGGMQGYSNNTIDAFFVALILLLVGIVVVSLVFLGKEPELRAFQFTYGICVFVGGLAQLYSLAFFHDPQSTVDSFTFFQQIAPIPPFMTMKDIPLLFNSPLAVVTWQQVYKLTWWLGFKFGPYTGVMFNALVMGVTGSLTVQMARELFGNDSWRLRRVWMLFAFCGLFILFGAVLIRDCFTTFLNVLVLWGIIRWLVRQNPWNFLLAAALTGVSSYAMVYLRIQAVLLFALYWFLAFLFWVFTKRLDNVRLVAAIFAISVLLIASPYLADYMRMFQEIQARGLESYTEHASNTHSDDSLGMRLVVNQPLPIRLVLGSGMLMVFPIPLWANFNVTSQDSYWIRGYHGIYQVLVFPLVFAGFIEVFNMFQRNRKKAVPLLFLVVYLLMNLVGVVATSMEQRHFAQFMPAFIILAALPDTRKKKARIGVQIIAMGWFAVVVLVHLAWAIMKS